MANALALTAEDVRRLLEDDGPETRVDLTDKIAGAYNDYRLNDKEVMIAEQVFRLLLRDTELRVRMSLAQHLKANTAIAHDIILAMAQDVEQVALPVLECSVVLTDYDLLELIAATHEASRFIAISRRAAVSDIVSDRLVEKGDDKVVAVLLNNPGVELSEHSAGRIIETHRHNEALMNALGRRPRLPVTCVEKLIGIVSANLADNLKKKYQLPSEQIEAEIDKTRESETLNVIRVAQSQEDIDRLTGQLHAFNRLSPSIVLSALCQGNFGFFETSLARLSGLAVSNVRTLIQDRGELGFRAVYNKSGLPDALFPAVKMLLSVVRELDEAGEKPNSTRYANRVVERILQYSEENPVENLSYIIALVRRIGQ